MKAPLSTLSAAILALTAYPAAAEDPAPAATADPLVLKIGVNDIYCRKTACECISEIAKRSYDGVLAALAKDHGITLEFTYFMEVMDLEKAIRAKRFDGVVCKPWTALRLAGEADADFVRVVDIRDPDDQPNMTGVFLVPKDSPIRTLADLKGRRVAFGQPDSFEKYHAPLAMLGDKRISPAAALYLNSCGENLDALMSGKVDAAVVSSYALTASCAADFAKPEDFRTIATTPEMPLTSVIVDRKRIPGTKIARLREALLKLSGDKVPADLTGKGFVAPVHWQPVPVGLDLVVQPAKP